MVSMLLGEVSEKTYVFWFKLSPGALVSFHCTMVSGHKNMLSVTGNVQNSLS
jgi:hypothetical protein